MKIFTLGKCLGAAMLRGAATCAASTSQVAMLIGYESAENENAQESAAAQWFRQTYSDGIIITPTQIDKIDAGEIKALWIHIDRVGIGMGYDRLPSEFNNPEMKAALTKYVKDGGSLYLSKFATQMVHELGRLDAAYAPGIFGDGDGGKGTDVWCVNAYLGSVQLNQPEPDMSQVYDRTSHQIYKNLETFEPNSEWGNFPHPSFPMLGTGTGEEIHREDHNCMWDLNAYPWTAEGKNTLEKFEKQFDCTVIGTWGHVQDYCVAGIVEFNPTSTIKGRIIANGLAACEWAPREGVNKYHGNLTALTENTLDYLANTSEVSVETINTDNDTAAQYYTLQGIRIDKPESGICIVVRNGKATKTVIR